MKKGILHMTSPRTKIVRRFAGTAAGALALAAITALPGSTSAAAAASAAAPGMTVTNETQLRKAVSRANRRAGSDTIRLGSDITFSDRGRVNGGAFFGDLDVSDDLVIRGGGYALDANGVDRIFDVRTTDATLSIRNLQMRNGRAVDTASGGAIRIQGGALDLRDSAIYDSVVSGDGASGGAVFNDAGTFKAVRTMLVRNTAARAGGAVEANGGDTKIIDSRMTRNNTGAGPGNGGALHLTGAGDVLVQRTRVARNTAAAEGGGLWNSADGTMIVDQSQLAVNAAAGVAADQGGGAVYNDGGTLSITASTLTTNRATGTAGSGGAVLSLAGELSIDESTLDSNDSQRAGGAVEIVAGTATISQSTLEANSTGGAPGNGGAVHVSAAADTTVVGSEVTDNTATLEGGGLWNSATGTMTVRGTELTGNTASGAAADNGGGGLYNDGGTMEVVRSDISENVADGAAGSGGGLLNNNGDLTVRGSTFDANTAPRAGGGIETAGNDATVTIFNTDLTDNTTGATPGNGGGLHLGGAGTVDYTRGLVTGNIAANEGGGLWNRDGTLTLIDVTATGNVAPDGPNIYLQPGGTGTNTSDGAPANDQRTSRGR